MATNELRKQIEDYIKGYLMTESVGFASVDRFESSPRGHHPTDLLPGAKTVIVYAVSIPAALSRFKHFFKDSELMPEFATVKDSEHWYDYTVQNPRMGEANTYISRYGYDWPQIKNQDVAFHLSQWLERLGYYTLPVPGSTGGWGTDLHHTPWRRSFSIRHAAFAAGLGEIGLSGLLLVPEYGPNIRLDCVITTAEFEPTPLFEEKLCLGEKCLKCIKKCASMAYGKKINYTVAGREISHYQLHWGTMDKSPEGTTCRSISKGYCGECQFQCPADKRLKNLQKKATDR